MTTSMAADLVRQAFVVVLLVAGPLLAVAMIVGVIVSLIQAITQIQEQTLTFVPKIVVMILVTVVLLGWISVQMMEFAAEMFT